VFKVCQSPRLSLWRSSSRSFNAYIVTPKERTPTTQCFSLQGDPSTGEDTVSSSVRRIEKRFYSLAEDFAGDGETQLLKAVPERFCVRSE
jgi:hypothetical protein